MFRESWSSFHTPAEMAAPRPFDEEFCRRNAGTVATSALKWLAGRVRHRRSGSCAEFRKKIVHILRIFCGQGTRSASFHRPSGALVLIFRKFLPRLMHRYHTVGYRAMNVSGVRVFTEARVVAMLTCVGTKTCREDWLLAMKLVSEVMFVHAVRLHQSKLVRAIKKQQEGRDADEVMCVGVVSARDALNAKFQAAEDNGSMIDLTEQITNYE